MAYITDVRNAVASMIVGLGTTPSIVPFSTLPTGAAVGATQLTLASAADAQSFVQGGLLSFWDSPTLTMELPVVIGPVIGATVNLSFRGRAPGLQFAHAPNTRVATNVILVPGNVDNITVDQIMMEGNGYPVLRVFVPRDHTAFTTNRGTEDAPIVSCIYRLPVTQTTGLWMQEDIYRQQQTDQASADLAVLTSQLASNHSLSISGTPFAKFVHDWEVTVIERDAGIPPNGFLPVLEQYLDIHIQGPWTFTG